MRSLGIAVLAPTFHDHPRLVQRIEEFAVEQFDLPGQTWSRMNVRLDRNQGGQGHAQETIYDTPEEIIQHLRALEPETGKGLAVLDACWKLGITELGGWLAQFELATVRKAALGGNRLFRR